MQKFLEKPQNSITDKKYNNSKSSNNKTVEKIKKKTNKKHYTISKQQKWIFKNMNEYFPNNKTTVLKSVGSMYSEQQQRNTLLPDYCL